ncbi:hypothetical protein HUN42_00083 [Streptomyces phage Dagobah]|nr:hypothetical protein HUN42_00083 [Streptomyces phage Dagobah]
MDADKLLEIISQVKDSCDRYERMELTPDQVVSEIIRLVAPVDTTPVE